MKKVLITLLFIALFACENQEHELYCWKCVTVSDGALVSTVTACGIGENDIRDFQEGLEVQAVSILGVIAETTCIKRTALEL